MAQWTKAIVTKSENLSLTPETHTVEEENWLPQFLGALWRTGPDTHVWQLLLLWWTAITIET